RPADRTRAKERALRAAQRLNAVQVVQVDVGCEERQRDDGLVEIDADLLLHAGLVAHDLSGRHSAHGALALAWTEVLDGETGYVPRQLLDVGGAELLDIVRSLRVD